MRQVKSRSLNFKSAFFRFAPVALLFAICGLVPTSSSFAESPNDSGALPYIVILMDTSSSIENTSQGVNVFPRRGNDTFVFGKNMHLLNSNNSLDIEGPQNPNAWMGPCAVWEPPSCSLYERPTHFVSNSNYGPDLYQNTDWVSMKNRLERIRHDHSFRLKDDNQPKHFTIKEILTGDMVLTPQATQDPEGLNPVDNGPGCWFIPRQRFSRVYPELQKYCKNTGSFTQYAESADPVPHIQEIYDYQRKNGLLDNLNRTAVFAFAGLDGFKEPGLYDDPYTNFPASVYPSGRTGFKEDGKCGSKDCYNLGVTRIVGPKKLTGMTLAEMNSASEYTQQAILDAGYLKKSTEKPMLHVSGTNPSNNHMFQPQDSRYLNDLPLGTQPIARATPLAAAIYDINNFFRLASVDMDNPLSQRNDEYSECRDRHVIILSDGSPSPEVASPEINAFIGNTSLSPAYSYDPQYFPYKSTAQEISFLHQYAPSLGNSVKVHVVALLDDLGPTLSPKELAERQERLRKLDQMAASGGTCASASLSDSWISSTSDPTQCARNGGPGNDLGKACLDTTPRGDFGSNVKPSYTYDIPGTQQTVPCEYPALVLTKNTRADIEAALAETLNSIIQGAGVKSRTRTVYSEDLNSVEVCNSNTMNATGVNEILSGVKIGGGPAWAGLLYRNTFACGCAPQQLCRAGSNANPPVFTDLGSQINDQVRSGLDNRRIFTSFLKSSSYNYTDLSSPNSFRRIDPGQPDQFFEGWPIEAPRGVGFAYASFGNNAHPQNLHYPGRSAGTQIELDYKALFESSLFTFNQQRALSLISRFVGLSSNNNNKATVEHVFDVLRGRVMEKKGRVLGGIFNGNPVTLDPPRLSIPIESYRQFKAANRNRPPVVFVPTIDGLLHAIYTGEGVSVNGNQTQGEVVHRVARSNNDAVQDNGAGLGVVDGGSSQREAWAYFPFTLLHRLADSQSSNPYLMDGSPVVKDVRLCNILGDYNQNHVACGWGNIEGKDQWRTVLVGGLGPAGKGYYALDVTYMGGRMDSKNPDRVFPPEPVVLWEFSPEIERLQVEHFYNKHSAELVDGKSGPCAGIDNRQTWERSLLGNSVGDAEIGTIVVNMKSRNSRTQRAVALFGGGESDPSAQPLCSGENKNMTGKAIYVMDMQTGSLLRRFVTYYDENKNEVPFDFPITGTPAFYNSFVGSVATRAFIGDQHGRLFKIDFTDPDPLEWKVYLFFDPARNASWFNNISGSAYQNGAPVFGPANYKPAISKMADENLLIVYGLGEVGDSISSNTAQAIIALRDRVGVDPMSSNVPVVRDADPLLNDQLWNVTFDPAEKMTGAPFIFDNVTYFPTFRVLNPSNLCIPGEPRINRVLADGSRDITEFENTDDKTIIRGLSLRINPCCSNGQTPPELVAQTGSANLTQRKGSGGNSNGNNNSNNSGNGNGNGSSNGNGSNAGVIGNASQTGELSTFRQTVQTPRSVSVPLSWIRVIN